MGALTNLGGAPKPFEMKSIRVEGAGQFLRYAVISCCACTNAARFPYRDDNLNPQMIAKRFERMGWEVYQSKARCPDCKYARARQKARFAKLAETTAMPPELVRMQRPSVPTRPEPPPAPPAPAGTERQYLLTVAADGTATVRPLEGARQMLFGEETFIVLPA